MVSCCCPGQGASDGGKADTVGQKGATVEVGVQRALGDSGAVVPALGRHMRSCTLPKKGSVSTLTALEF